MLILYCCIFWKLINCERKGNFNTSVQENKSHFLERPS